MTTVQPENPTPAANDRQEPADPSLARGGLQSRDGGQPEEPFPADLPHYETFDEWDAARRARAAAEPVFTNLRDWEAAQVPTQPDGTGQHPEQEAGL